MSSSGYDVETETQSFLQRFLRGKQVTVTGRQNRVVLLRKTTLQYITIIIISISRNGPQEAR
jgi:hypothetical protein